MFRVGKKLTDIFLDWWWLDPVLSGIVGVGLAQASWLLSLSVDDHGGFNQTLTSVNAALLTLAVLAITISLSQDLAIEVRRLLARARTGLVASLFGSLLWISMAAFLSCALYVVDSIPAAAGTPRTGIVCGIVVLATLSTVRIGSLLARLIIMNLTVI